MKGVTALIIDGWNGRMGNIVQQLAKHGWNMAIDGDENVIQTIQKEYQQGVIIDRPVNLDKERDIQNFVEQVLNQLQCIDVLIINNQCRKHYRASIEEFPSEKWRDIIDANLISTFTLIKTLWPHMKRQHFGRIIHLASEHSLTTSEYQSACIASHHALIGLNKALSIEGAPFGITSNIICPGYTQTNISEPFDQIKTLADLILYLCTDQARSITGHSIPWSSI